MKLETFARKHKLKIIADFDPQRLHRWHVRLASVYGCPLTHQGPKFSTFRSLPTGTGQSFPSACTSLTRQLQDGSLRIGGWMRPAFTFSVPKLKAA